jgi:transcriptional regulator with XRE-family HTH domain
MARRKKINTPEMEEKILYMSNAGMSQRLIAGIFDLSQGTISNFLSDKPKKEPEPITGDFFSVENYLKRVVTI